MEDLFRKFKELSSGSSATDFNALRLSGLRKDYLAKGVDGAPVLLLHDASIGQYNPGLQLRYLQSEFHVSCRLRTDEREVEDTFALVSCDANEPDLHELFIRSFDAARQDLPEECNTQRLRELIQGLAALFRSFSKPSLRSVSGLWAELFVIGHCGKTREAMAMWRATAFDRFDFSRPGAVIEVKATTSQVRTHEFALEQLAIPKGGKGFVISLLLQQLTGGVGIMDLVVEIEASITSEPRLREKLWSNVLSDLGSDFSEVLDRRFDPTFADKHLFVFEMQEIPMVRPVQEPRISSIRFVANLTDMLPLADGFTSKAIETIFNYDS
jgi:hypothetical protein